MEKPYKNLLAWKESHDLALRVYRCTKTFPTSERYGVASQLRRASLSVPTNIVEGQAKPSKKDFVRYLYIARGSITEVEYLIEFARDVGLVSADIYTELESQRAKADYLLERLIQSLG